MRTIRQVLQFIYKYPYWAIIIGPLVLFSREIFGLRAFFWGLPILQFIPWRVAALEMIREGAIPLWNSLNGFGAPLLANFQSALLYPPSWLLGGFYFLGGVSWLAYGFTLLTIAHLVLAGFGMVRFLTKLGLSPFAQNIGAIAFSLSGYLVARTGFYSMIWTAAWLPWLMAMATNKRKEQKEEKYRLVKVATPVVMILLAGHAQLAFYCLLITIFWVIFQALNKQTHQQRFSAIFVLGISLVIGIGISAVQLLPTAEYLLNTARSNSVAFQDAMTYSFWPAHGLNFLNPNFFGSPSNGNYWGYGNGWEDAVYLGVFPLLLTTISLVGVITRKINREVKVFFLAVSAISFILSLGTFTPIYKWLFEHVPTFSMFQSPTRWMILAVFSFTTLASIGADELMVPTGKLRYWINLAAMGFFAIIAGSCTAYFFLPGLEKTILLAAMVFGASSFIALLLWLHPPKNPKNITRYQFLIVLFLLLDLLINWFGYQPSISLSDPLWAQFGDRQPTVSFMPSTDEYWIKFRRFFQLASFEPTSDWSNLAGSELPNLNLLSQTASANNFDPFVPERFSTFQARINDFPSDAQVRILSRFGVSQLANASPRDKDGITHTQLSANPLASWFKCANWVDSSDEAWDYIRQYGEGDQAEILVLERNNHSLTEIGDCEEAKSVDLDLSATGNKLTVIFSATSDGYMILRQSYFPGWSATLDGNRAEILHADYLFMAIRISAGVHTVVWKYAPSSFIIGCVITLVSLIILVFITVRKKRGQVSHGLPH